ncbi:MAG: hypothetical protein Q9167_007034 [Letrouitia subvulpina]
MVEFNQSLKNLGVDRDELHPYHVFQLVAGTSTGGLIALMLGKMGMTVKECIREYERLSKVVFGRKHLRGRVTHGLARARYSGKGLHTCVRQLLNDRQLNENLSMSDKVEKAGKVACLPCNDNLVCKVCDAARATSAAPTFFPVMKIRDRFFTDGGLAHNNPSFAIYFHYTGGERKKSTKPMTASGTSAPQYSPHGDLDCSRVRFTNIGTGAKASEVEPGKRDRLANLVPGFIRKGVFLKQTLTEIAVNSEEKADVMRQFQYLNPDVFKYERFDADHGVSNFKLDAYNALGQIREKTELYLAEQETKDLLKMVGSAIAIDYLNLHPTLTQNAQLTDLSTDKYPRLEVSDTMPASSSLSSGPSSRSEYRESGSLMLYPNHESLLNGEQTPLTSHPITTLDMPNAQQYSQHEDFSDSAIDTASAEQQQVERFDEKNSNMEMRKSSLK